MDRALELHNLHHMLLLTVVFINCIKGAGELGANLAEIAFAAAILTIQPFVPNSRKHLAVKFVKDFKLGFPYKLALQVRNLNSS